MNIAKLKIFISMIIFGTIGIFVQYIPLSRSLIASARGFIGALFILVFVLVTGKKISLPDIKKNFFLLAITGCFIGINWILLFESYEQIGVANGTLCYYLQPSLLVIGAAFIYKEKISPLKASCVAIALVGMVFVSGVFPPTEDAMLNPIGIALGVGAAFFYALVILINRNIKGISSYDMTMVQLFFAALIALVHVIITGNVTTGAVTPLSIVLLFVIGIIHTGVAYALYFDGVRKITSQSVAVISYTDPVVSILLSMIILKEGFTPWGILGAVMILGSTFVSELKKSQ